MFTVADAVLSVVGVPSLQMRDYISALELHVGEVQRQANRMVKRQAVMGSSLNNFGRSMVALGK